VSSSVTKVSLGRVMTGYERGGWSGVLTCLSAPRASGQGVSDTSRGLVLWTCAVFVKCWSLGTRSSSSSSSGSSIGDSVGVCGRADAAGHVLRSRSMIYFCKYYS